MVLWVSFWRQIIHLFKCLNTIKTMILLFKMKEMIMSMILVYMTIKLDKKSLASSVIWSWHWWSKYYNSFNCWLLSVSTTNTYHFCMQADNDIMLAWVNVCVDMIWAEWQILPDLVWQNFKLFNPFRSWFDELSINLLYFLMELNHF